MPIWLCLEVNGCGVLPRIPEQLLAVRGPVVCLIEVATKAAVNQIAIVVTAAGSDWLEVIDAELAAGIRFGDAAKLTGKVRPLADELSHDCGDGHAGRPAAGEGRRCCKSVIS